MSAGCIAARWLGISSLCVCAMNIAQAEIVILAPSATSIPEGAWIANAPGISYGNSASGYALHRSQAWRMQDGHSVPSAQNYWLVLPGNTSSYGLYGHYGYSTSAIPHTQSPNARVANTRSHVARANAYRTKLFER